MEDNVRHKFDKEFVRLGAYQFIGGLIGLVLLIYSIYINGFNAIAAIFFLIIFLFFYGYSIVCGILCLKRHELALTFSYINQLLQIIAISITGYTYKYVAGLYLSLFFDFTHNINFTFGLGISNMELQFNTDSNITMLQINLVAIACMIWIDKLKGKIKNEALQMRTEEIGSA